ncbi:MAG: endonuclease/exonuclease/phosphatase family protein [Actinocatenispora sp.]
MSRILGYALLFVLGAVVVLRWTGLGRVTPLVQATMLVPYLAVVSLIATLVLFGVQRRGLGAWALVITVAYALALLPRWAVEPSPRPAGTQVRVMTVNLHNGEADARSLVRRVAEQEPDLLSVQELTGAEATRLGRAGLGRYLPYHVLRTAPKSSGTGLYARTPLSAGRGLSSRSTYDLARAEMQVGSRTLDVVAVHARPPLLGQSTPDWYRDLRLLPDPGEPSVQLLAGDFNGTDDQQGFREVLHHGYQDAAISVGRGLKPTWHRFPVPPVTIDHVLAESPLTPVTVRTYEVLDANHRALVADLVLKN